MAGKSVNESLLINAVITTTRKTNEKAQIFFFFPEAKNIQINFHCKVKELLQWRITGLNVSIMT